jgi:hypothetical protein
MTIDPTKTPKTMDVAVTGKPDDAQVLSKAIYELDGDTLRICAGEEVRPEAFKTTAETGITQLMVLKREKRAPKDKDGENPKTDNELLAWGEAVNGLQAGVGLRPADKRSFRAGEKLELVLKVRNLGKERQSFGYYSVFADIHRPIVEDTTGHEVRVAMPDSAHLPRLALGTTLEPGAGKGRPLEHRWLERTRQTAPASAHPRPRLAEHGIPFVSDR